MSRAALREIATIATADTLLRWYRRLIARKWTCAQQPGWRNVLVEIRRLVVRMAEKNPTWGYTRIQGALKDLGHRVGGSTIRRILKAAGPSPVPQRPTSWQTFLKAHWGSIAAADFLTTEIWTWHGLVTYYSVFIMRLRMRRGSEDLHAAGCEIDGQGTACHKIHVGLSFLPPHTVMLGGIDEVAHLGLPSRTFFMTSRPSRKGWASLDRVPVKAVSPALRGRSGAESLDECEASRIIPIVMGGGVVRWNDDPLAYVSAYASRSLCSGL